MPAAYCKKPPKIFGLFYCFSMDLNFNYKKVCCDTYHLYAALALYKRLTVFFFTELIKRENLLLVNSAHLLIIQFYCEIKKTI